MNTQLYEEIATLKAENKRMKTEVLKANKQVDFAITMLGLCLILSMAIMVVVLLVR